MPVPLQMILQNAVIGFADKGNHARLRIGDPLTVRAGGDCIKRVHREARRAASSSMFLSWASKRAHAALQQFINRSTGDATATIVADTHDIKKRVDVAIT